MYQFPNDTEDLFKGINLNKDLKGLIAWPIPEPIILRSRYKENTWPAFSKENFEMTFKLVICYSNWKITLINDFYEANSVL